MSQQQENGGQENTPIAGNQGQSSPETVLMNRSGGDGPMNQYVQMIQSNSTSTKNQYQSTAQQIIYPRVGGVANMLTPLTLPSGNASSTNNGQTSQETSAFTIPAIANVIGSSTTISSDIDSMNLQQSNSKKSTTFNMSTSGVGRQNASANDEQLSTTLGGVPIPPMPANTSTAMQVQMAAVSAAKAAAPHKGYHGPKSTVKMDDDKNGAGNNLDASTNGKARKSTTSDLTPEEKKKLNRDRNRQHARSTRLRKKAYTNKLKELVNALHVERSDVIKKRRVAVRQLAEIQNVRRGVITKFLTYHSGYETDIKTWNTILEEDFFLKQPVSPYRSFPRSEIKQEQDRVSQIILSRIPQNCKFLIIHYLFNECKGMQEDARNRCNNL